MATLMIRRKIQRHCLVAFLLLFQGYLAGQTGLLSSDERYQSVHQLPVYSGKKYNEVPLRISLRKYCPLPGDQGKMGACVGWATGYGALTIMRARKAGETDPSVVTEMANSAAFIYNQVKLEGEDCTSGAYIEDALQLLRDRGDCLEQSFNYQQQDCSVAPSQLQLAEAKHYQIQDFAAVFALDEPPKSKVSKACKVLATETPVIIGIGITHSFRDLKPGSRLWDPEEQESVTGYHALIVVGYDNVEKQFELMNSFGPGWGLNGFVRIKYDDFERLCRYAYVLMPDQSAAVRMAEVKTAEDKLPAALSGAFVFRKPAGYLTTTEGEELPYFEEVQTRLNATSGIYEPVEATYAVGEVFQLVAREIPAGRYAYVFSQNPDGKVNLHFPKMAVASGKTAGFVLSNQAEIVIPSETSVLQLAAPGEDYLCILYSEKQIRDFDARFAQLQQDTGTLPERVDRAFEPLLIPRNRIQFSNAAMAFQALPETGGRMAVPLILKVKAE
ncbi:MAG: C1 family peptidase [Saprospiraceae bacterium]